MDRINGADTIDIGGGRRGFRDENLAAGAAGTEVTALHLNSVQEEILKVITSAGLVPSDADWSQLWQALNALGLSPQNQSRQWLAVISITLSSPPGSPGIGDTYYIPANASGLWAGKFGQIAQWTGSSWRYFVNNNGQGLGLPDGRVFINCFGLGLIEKPALDVQSGKWSFAVAGGTENALTTSLTPAPDAYREGTAIRLKVAAINTGPATLNVNGLGAKAIRRADQTPLIAGDLVTGQIVELIYDATGWQISGLLTSLARGVGVQSYTTAGTFTWTAPAGVTRVEVELWAGGGGAASAPNVNGQYGGAAGAGGYSLGVYDVTPGAKYTVVVGAGGSGALTANSNAPGAPGGLSSFSPEGGSALIYATGGQRGEPRSVGGSGPGQGMLGTILNLRSMGGSGSGAGVNDPPVGGSAARGGAGGLTGSPGTQPGGGAGGAYFNGVPAAGAAGLVLLRW
ncbi:DUF2793 domain-containing protein [Agrobacterium sp. S7/73]|uniref:glycine-rich domain-containing protein n=1 Tax=Agrobacterium sp. S7/73 TaxID=2820002 RepID=UPI001C5B2A7E|nr:DUF2793 domain-containing protein [Agrobacterium sp. S7/73]QXZ71879.1 DUF2793 domain-containing protein [Agrobacterium sp. S7/73]QXZ74667.1 DUF2793 domain-containing protein [Agrobacterium sp. S7/73]